MASYWSFLVSPTATNAPTGLRGVGERPGQLLMVVIIHHKPSTLYIEMVTNRNLGVLTNNFHKFW
jgi:hypothetical protein